MDRLYPKGGGQACRVHEARCRPRWGSVPALEARRADGGLGPESGLLLRR
jgi:hypothetical protein